MNMRYLLAPALAAFVAFPAMAQVQKKEVAGIRNYSRVDATVGCGGAVDPAAMAALKTEGSVSVINLRLANEPGPTGTRARRGPDSGPEIHPSPLQRGDARLENGGQLSGRGFRQK